MAMPRADVKRPGLVLLMYLITIIALGAAAFGLWSLGA